MASRSGIDKNDPKYKEARAKNYAAVKAHREKKKEEQSNFENSVKEFTAENSKIQGVLLQQEKQMQDLKTLANQFHLTAEERELVNGTTTTPGVE